MLRRRMHQLPCECVRVFLCMSVMHRSQAGRETTGPGCSPKAELLEVMMKRVEGRQSHSSPCRRFAEIKFLVTKIRMDVKVYKTP